MNISLCITTYNRPELTLKSFEKVLNDDRISEVIIVDDCSTENNFLALASKCYSDKISLYRNDENLGMSRNKAKAISLASNDWCIIFDSDNVLDKSYLDALKDVELKPDTIYMPSKATPNFDFSAFSGMIFNTDNIRVFVEFPMFRVCLNTSNNVVHRDTYISTYKHDPLIKGADTINHNFNHLVAGGSFYIVPNLEYMHLVHSGSGFREHMDFNMKCAAELENKIRQL